MSRKIITSLWATASVLSLAQLQPAHAQSADQPAAQAAGSGIEEVVVTARRREEKAQTVPITLETFSPERLAKEDIRDPLTLTNDIPGFNGATGGSLGLTYTFLRGAPGVVFYFNQVPINVNNQDQGFYFDMQSIQVLYGPQGTLFGLSNDAGAILFEPKHPTNDFEGYGQVTFGDYGRQTIEGVVNVPIVQDKLTVRVGAQYQKQDGYQHVIEQNIDLLNQNYWNFRGSANFTPTDDLSNEFMINYFNTQYLPGAYTLAAVNPGPAQAFGAPLQTILTYGQMGYIGPLAAADLAGKNINLNQLLAQQEQLGKYTLAGLAFVPTAILKQLNIIDTATWDINDQLTLKNIAAYQNIYNYVKADIGGLSFGVLDGPTPIQSTPPGPTVQYNEEIQLLGEFFNGKLKLTSGFFNQWGGSSQGGVANTTAPYGIVYTNDFGGVSVSGLQQTQTSRTDAVYSQGTYDLGDYVSGLSFTGGFRYTWDKFYTQENSYSPYGVLIPVSCLTPQGTVTTAGCATSQAARFRSPSYSLQLSYMIDPQTMLYINNSLGYKTGGFNGQDFVGPFEIYRPEHLNNYEAGIKSDFDLGAIGLDSVKAQVDASAYYGVYRDIEIQTTGAYLTVAGTKSLGTPYLDVGPGDLWGWDLQFTVIPFPDITLHADAEYNRGKYKNFQGPNAAGTGQTSVPGVAFEVLPEYKANGSITYDLSFVDKAYGEVSWTGTYSWTQHSINTDVAEVTQYDILPGYHTINMSLDWKDILGHTGLSGRVFVTNLMNNSVVNGTLGAYYAIGLLGLQPAQPQMWGVTLRYDFSSPNVPPATGAPYVPPAAQAPAPAVAHSYMVFFDFNKSDLTPDAVSVVDQAAKNAGPAHATEITCTGHTDTVGSDAYNMRLSRRRAESVAAELEKQGIPSSQITLVAKGKQDLLVPTGDGVREPQNRRVTIVYSGGVSS